MESKSSAFSLTLLSADIVPHAFLPGEICPPYVSSRFIQPFQPVTTYK